MQVNHLASLAKRLSVRLETKWLWVWIPLLSHIVLSFNTFAKLQNASEESFQPVFMSNCPTCINVLALSVCWMVCYQSVPGVAHGTRSYGHERVASWKESWHEIYAGKRTQK